MTTIERHAPGSFCWIELATPDQEAAKSFYGSLFGWSSIDRPAGPNSIYTIFQLQERSCAAAFKLDEEARSKGIPPYWGLYVAVESADDAARRAAELGGKVVPAFDVFEAGRVAEVVDPTGGHFSVWQPKNNTGTGIKDIDGTLCWADLNTPDPARAKEFYSALFGWRITPGENDPYLHIQNGEEFIGGIPPAEHLPPNTPTHWLAYFKVSDCDKAAARVTELGGRVYMGPMTIEKVGRWAVVADPQGAVFSIFQPLPHS